jgi:hypothetical protein
MRTTLVFALGTVLAAAAAGCGDTVFYTGAAFSDDGREVAYAENIIEQSGGSERVLEHRIFLSHVENDQVPEGRPLDLVFEGSHYGNIYFMRSKEYLVLAGVFGAQELVRLDGTRIALVTEEHTEWQRALPSQDGSLIVTSIGLPEEKRTLLVFFDELGAQVHTASVPINLLGVAWSEDGRLFVDGTWWPPELGSDAYEIEPGQEPRIAFADRCYLNETTSGPVAPDGRRLIHHAKELPLSFEPNLRGCEVRTGSGS